MEIAINPTQIARLHSNMVRSFITLQVTHYKCLSSKVKFTAYGNVSAVKNATIWQLIGSATSNLT